MGFEESSVTCEKTTKIRYMCEIHDFSTISTEISHSVKSTEFLKSLGHEYDCKLTLHPNGRNKTATGFLVLHLDFRSGKKSKFNGKYRLGILKNNKQRYYPWGYEPFQEPPRFSPAPGYTRSIERIRVFNPDLGLLSDDVLTILCDIIIVEDILNTIDKNDSQASQIMDHHGLSNNLIDLFESQKFCDIKLITNGMEIEAHKAILAARSPVFAAIFDSEMKEQENRVEIIDVNYDVLKEMLRFMYTGKTTNLEKMADGLLMAANKYELKTLKGQCEHALLKTIEVDNAVSLLVLADLHCAVRLKSAALDFICTHMKAVMKTLGYRSLHRVHPHLIDEIVKALASKITVSEI